MKAEKFHRSSRQREVILEELKKLKTHPTARHLHEIVRKRLPRTSLGTIYRNLDHFSRKGIIQKLEFGGNEARFDGDTDRHYHVYCIKCGRIDDVPDLAFDDKSIDLSNVAGYDIRGYHMNIFGICSDCRGIPETNLN